MHILGLALLSAAATLPGVRVTPLRSFDLLAPAVALAFADEGHVLVLGPDDVRLVDTQTGALTSRIELPGRVAPSRLAAGLLSADPEARSAWLIVSRRSGAFLVDWSEGGLTVRAEAERMPWPGQLGGLRYVPGTALLEGPGDAFWLTLEPGPPALFVLPRGELLAGTLADGRLVGPTLASLWPGWCVASTARPPGEQDALLVLTLSESGTEEVLSFELPGAIRAVTSRLVEGTALLAVAVESEAGRFRLEILRFERP